MNTAKLLAGLFGTGLAVSLAANALLYQRYSSSRPVLTMEAGGAITRKEFKDNLEYFYGKQVMQKMVFTRLVEDAAKKAGVTVTDADVEARLKEMERIRPGDVQAARSDPGKFELFKNDLKTEVALERLRVKDVEVSGKEARAFYERNKARFVNPTRVQTVSVVSGNRVDASTAEELLRQGTAPDIIARQPRLQVVGVRGYLPDMTSLPPQRAIAMQKAMTSTPPGGVRTVDLGGAFLSFRVKKADRTGVMPFEQVKGQAEHLARLEKAPPAAETLAKLYHRAGVTFEMNQYAAYFNDVPKVSESRPRQTASAR